MSRLDVTEKIITTKVAKGLKWADVAAKVGLSKEWVTAGCLGQMTFNAEQAGVIAEAGYDPRRLKLVKPGLAAVNPPAEVVPLRHSS